MTKTTKKDWQKAQEFEHAWWGNCVNTFNEESKQTHYALGMGLTQVKFGGHLAFDLSGKSVLDLGGGVVSLLLKSINGKDLVVVDPLEIPGWAKMRYRAAGIQYAKAPAEEADKIFKKGFMFDEVWIYNVLQHTINPKKIIDNATKLGRLVRIFEWLDTPAHDGHPQTLKENKLNKWLNGKGKVRDMSKEGFAGFVKAYYGVFPTKHYKGEINL